MMNNIILELEKAAINLGAAISESDEPDGVELTEADLARIEEESENNGRKEPLAKKGQQKQ